MKSFTPRLQVPDLLLLLSFFTQGEKKSTIINEQIDGRA